MAARKRLALPRTIAVSRIRNGRVYFWLAAWRTISKSRLTSGCVSKSCSCGCRSEASRLAANDRGVEDQERSGVLLAGGLAHDLEVETDLGMCVEELFLRLQIGSVSPCRERSRCRGSGTVGCTSGWRPGARSRSRD